jgi:uncharacterized membrane protein YjjP (DUF1212 family)
MTYPSPEWHTIDLFALGLASAAFFALWSLRWNVLWIVGGSALAGFIYQGIF